VSEEELAAAERAAKANEGEGKTKEQDAEKGGQPEEEIKPALPDRSWSKNAPKQVEPGTKVIVHEKFNWKTGKLERSEVYYDEYGRQIGRTDYSDHGYPKEHPGEAHHHVTGYSSKKTSHGQESDAQPGPFPNAQNFPYH
jgi:hypothetical protein